MNIVILNRMDCDESRGFNLMVKPRIFKSVKEAKDEMWNEIKKHFTKENKYHVKDINGRMSIVGQAEFVRVNYNGGFSEYRIDKFFKEDKA